MCGYLGFSKQAYYKSIRLKKLKSLNNVMVKNKVMALRHDMPRLGTRKLYYLLKDKFRQQGIAMGRDRLFDLLRSEGMLITKKKKYTSTTDSRHWMHKYPNLIKDMQVRRPEQLWVADITYVSVSSRFCYLHLVTDAYSRKIMGYHVSTTLAAIETLKALQIALKGRKYNHELVHHSDRGLQYCSRCYVEALKKSSVRISMTQDGSPYDNAIAERVNGILKDEYGLDDHFKDQRQLKQQVRQAVESYNNRRPHQSNHLLTPARMHQQDTLEPKTWHKKSARTKESSSRFLPSPPIY